MEVKISKFARVRKSRFVEQGGLCFYCGIEMWDLWFESRKEAKIRLGIPGASKRQMRFRMSTAEHLIRQVEGGGSGENIVACCGWCNWHRGVEPHSTYKGRSSELQ